MKNYIVWTLLWIWIWLTAPESISSMDHEKIINDIKTRAHKILELKEQEKNLKKLRIQ